MTAEYKPLAERVRDALALLPSREDAYEYRVRLAGLWPTHRALIADLWSTHPQNPAATMFSVELCAPCGKPWAQPNPDCAASHHPAAQGEARDAARYRWLRLRMNTQETVALPMGYKLDAAIDAALAVGETKGGA